MTVKYENQTQKSMTIGENVQGFITSLLNIQNDVEYFYRFERKRKLMK